MHINFFERKSFEFNLKSLKKIQYKDINLQKLKLNRLIMLLVAGGLLFTMLSFGVLQKLRLDYLLGKKIKLDREVSKLRNDDDVGSLSIDGNSSKEDILKSYHQAVKWNVVLAKVIEDIPPQVWLKSVSAQQEQSRMFSLTGEAPNQQIVAALIDSLERSNLFHNVQLISSEMVEDKGSRKLNFKVNCILKVRL
ncbi:MAG: PilN domain-containing protein [Pseudomonadota bacterium]